MGLLAAFKVIFHIINRLIGFFGYCVIPAFKGPTTNDMIYMVRARIKERMRARCLRSYKLIRKYLDYQVIPA
jgi:hypothetical protein